MRAGGSVLTLDIATQMGWAYGVPGTLPRSDSVRLAPPGSSNGQIGRGLMVWMADFLKVNTIDALYLEAPLDPRHMGKKTTFGTARVLIGLAFLTETLAEAKNITLVREANVQDVREYFVGARRPKNPKDVVKARCRQLGWRYRDDNAADALALWAFACGIEDPRSGIATAPLFGHNGGPPLGADPDQIFGKGRQAAIKSHNRRRVYDDVPDLEF